MPISETGSHMHNRWAALALLFTVRLGMAFQYHLVAAISPVVMRELGVGLADIGLMISLYLAPGVAIALPGGEIGRRWGDKSAVLFGLALMIGGGLLMAFASAWGWQLAGRLLAGVGGVLLNVLMSKMVTDWFAGKEIATAMGIFVNSWPIGIALALVALPPVTAAWGTTGAQLSACVLALLGLLLIGPLYRAPPHAAADGGGTWPAGVALWAVVAAGLIWGFYNAALGMVFGFGTAMLTERGWTLAAAGSATSLFLWLGGISVPLGGIVADRTGRHVAVMLGGFALAAAALPIAARTEAVMPAFAVLGLISGISAGPIMSLPARVLVAETRAAGMGIFYTIFYAMGVAGPIVGGWAAAMAGTSAVAFDVGVLMLAGCFLAYSGFRYQSSVISNQILITEN
jgi:MFS family permease